MADSMVPGLTHDDRSRLARGCYRWLRTRGDGSPVSERSEDVAQRLNGRRRSREGDGYSEGDNSQ